MEYLQLSHRDAAAVMVKDDIIHNYLKHHMSQYQDFRRQAASIVDLDKYVYKIFNMFQKGK